MIDTIIERIAEIRQRIDAAARVSGRDGSAVTLVGVSKTFPREVVDAAYAAGIRVFGENRVQEARAKFEPPLPADAEVHLIGQLQTNKVKHAVGIFRCIESVDRASLIDALAKEAAKRDIVVPVLLQVNIAGEEQKSGCAPADVEVLLDQIDAEPHVRCDGFMTIAPLVLDPEDARPTFAGLRELRDRLRPRLQVLSMGMSGDYEVAIAEGATHIRLGRALFGSRG